jgi:hypothetical protein
VGKGIRERELGERVTYRVLDPAAFASDGGPSIAERLYNGSGKKCSFRRADNKRVAKEGAIAGWDQLRARLVGEDGRPMLYVFDNCIHLIRTLPALQHDPNRPEDVDSDGEDHACDAARYGCMSRPWLAAKEFKKPALTFERPTMNDLWKEHDRNHGGMGNRI